MRKKYYLYTEYPSGLSPTVLAYDVSWNLDVSNFVRVDIILEPDEVFNSFNLGSYDNLNDLCEEDIHSFFNLEITESLLVSLIELIQEKLIYNYLDIKGSRLIAEEDWIALELLIQVEPLDYNIGSADFDFVFGSAFSEISFCSPRDSYIVVKGRELHHLYYEGN